MGPPSARTKTEMLKAQAEAQEQRRREDNAKKARVAADQLFPNEKWGKVEEGIYKSPRRKTDDGSNFEEEVHDAKILKSFGSTVYLVPEDHTLQNQKQYDAIVNGQKMEFKNVRGNASTLETQFLRSREQAPNVFINLEQSNLTRHEVVAALYGARNKPSTPATVASRRRKGYEEYNKFKGGKIILKIKEQDSLIYLNVDDLKISGQ